MREQRKIILIMAVIALVALNNLFITAFIYSYAGNEGEPDAETTSDLITEIDQVKLTVEQQLETISKLRDSNAELQFKLNEYERINRKLTADLADPDQETGYFDSLQSTNDE